MKKIGLLILVLVSTLKLLSQSWGEDDNLGTRNIGLRLGAGMYGIFGGELQNPTPKVGFQAGFFWYGSKPEKRLNWQTGLEASFCGSNFNNKDSFGNVSNSNYSQLGLIQLDIPLLVNIRIKQFSENIMMLKLN